MALGYAWTYAYGGLEGVGFGALVLLLGSWLGASLSYTLGAASPLLTAYFASQPPSSRAGKAFDRMSDYPYRLLLLLRSSPFVPFTPLNLYCGATDRFTFQQFSATFLAFMPLAFMYTGIGGAILKYRLIDRGLADPERYLGFIWTGFSLAIVFTLAMAGLTYYTYTRVVQAAPAGGASASTITLTTTGGPSTTRAGGRYSKTNKADLEDGTTVALAAEANAGVPPPPPPPPGPPPEETLPPGWRMVMSDDGEYYYFNDDTGEYHPLPLLRLHASAHHGAPIPFACRRVAVGATRGARGRLGRIRARQWRGAHAPARRAPGLPHAEEAEQLRHRAVSSARASPSSTFKRRIDRAEIRDSVCAMTNVDTRNSRVRNRVTAPDASTFVWQLCAAAPGAVGCRLWTGPWLAVRCWSVINRMSDCEVARAWVRAEKMKALK